MDMLVSDLITAELDHRDVGNFDIAASGGDAGRHEIDFAIVRETDNEFVDDAVGADGAAKRRDPGISREARDEGSGVEGAQSVVAAATGHGGDMIDVGFGD